MQKRHDDSLTARIEEVAHKGWGVIAWWEAYLWYDQQKLGKNFWRDLRVRFNEHKLDDAELYIYETPDGLLLIEGSKLKPISDKAGPPEVNPSEIEF